MESVRTHALASQSWISLAAFPKHRRTDSTDRRRRSWHVRLGGLLPSGSACREPGPPRASRASGSPPRVPEAAWPSSDPCRRPSSAKGVLLLGNSEPTADIRHRHALPEVHVSLSEQADDLLCERLCTVSFLHPRTLSGPRRALGSSHKSWLTIWGGGYGRAHLGNEHRIDVTGRPTVRRHARRWRRWLVVARRSGSVTRPVIRRTAAPTRSTIPGRGAATGHQRFARTISGVGRAQALSTTG